MNTPEHCRAWIGSDPDGVTRCDHLADVIVWGKLLDADCLGPRCWGCAEFELGHRNAHDPAYAIYRIPGRPDHA